MNYQITSDNIELSASMEALAKQKFERIENRIKNYPEDEKFVRIVLNSVPEEKFVVKIELVVNGRKYFSDETDFSLEGALIKAVEEVFQMMEKEKSVMERKRNKQSEVVLGEEFEELVEEK